MADDVKVTPARLSLDMVGSSTGDIDIAWDERETILYALGVGAGLGAPDRELTFTTENTEGVVLHAIPSFLTILALRHQAPPIGPMDKAPFLHGDQQIELLRPLPASGRGLVRVYVESVFDKGVDGIANIVSELRGAQDRSLIARARAGMFIRGGGGFGGERGSAAPWSLPQRDPDVSVSLATRPEQALLYRLSGDRHPLHSDPVFARAQGFERPILHGLATYGFACRALVQGFCGGDSTRLTSMGGRFTQPVMPGETLVMQGWETSPGRAVFRLLREGAGLAIDRGEATWGPPR